MKLELQHVKKSFGTQKVLKDISVSFESGKIYGLLGRNGAGKTTLFHCILKEYEHEGVILLDESSIASEDVSMLHATPILPEFLTGYEYLKFMIDVHQNKSPKSVEEYLELIDFKSEDAHKLIKDYSSGMKAKLSLLSIFIEDSKVLLLDEPLTNVDIIFAEQIKDIFRALKKDHIIILSTHQLDLAKNLCDEVVLLHEGISQKLPKDVKDSDFDQALLEALRA